MAPMFEAWNNGDIEKAWQLYMDVVNSINDHAANIDATTSEILQQLKNMENSINGKIDEVKSSNIRNKNELIMALNALSAQVASVKAQIAMNQAMSAEQFAMISRWFAKIDRSINSIDITMPSAKDYTNLLYNILDAINNIQAGEVTVNIDMSTMESLVDAILSKLDTMDEHQKQNALTLLTAINNGNTEIVNAINNLSKQGKENLKTVINAIDNNTSVAKGSYEILVWFMNNINRFDRADDIIAAIKNLSISGGVDLTEVMNYLQKLLDAANDNNQKLDFIAKIGEQAIIAINNIEMGNVTVNIDLSKLETLVKTILSRLGDMDEHQQQMALDVLTAINNGKSEIVEAINNLSRQGKTDLQTLINAVNRNTEVAEGSYEILVWFMNNIDKFDRADDIIAAIKNASFNVNVDLSSIIPYLEQILESSLANGGKIDMNNEYIKKIYDWAINTLTSKIDTLNALGNNITVNQKEELEWAEKIYNKIPPAHECDHSVLIQILIEIEDLLAKHEGTDQPGDGNLDDLFSYNDSVMMNRNDRMNNRAGQIRDDMLKTIHNIENSAFYAKLSQDAKKGFNYAKTRIENDSKTYRIYEDMWDRDFLTKVLNDEIESMA